MPPEDRVILTVQPEAASVALNEIQKLDGGARLLSILNQEARLVSLPGGYDSLLNAMRTVPVIFVRHLFPVQYGGLLETVDETSFLPAPDSAFCGHPFSVQMRTAPRDEILYARALVLVNMAEQALISRGFTQNDKYPAWVVSLFFHEDKLYAGTSWCRDNRSAWNGGAMRFKREPGFVSRAEFKLLEAFETFSITPPIRIGTPKALDLGAAPGGWTRILLGMGFDVNAIDPAALDSIVAAHPRLTHIRDIAQHFNYTGEPFDLIVNDMRMDITESCRIMCDMASCLHPDGAALMTLKLSPGHWLQKTIKGLTALNRCYQVMEARQLFHNRDEVTVYMRAKNHFLHK